MTNRMNRRAEEFDRALSADGASIDPKLASLVAVAGALVAMPQKAAPAFKETLRAQLMSEAASIAASGVPAATGAVAAGGAGPVGTMAKVLAKPAMQVATGGLAATIAATGVGIGASRSLPGDPLYGLKRRIETLQNGLAGGSIDEAGTILGHADTRVEEVLALLDTGATLERIESTLDELKDEIDTATSELLDQVRAGSRAAYDKLSATVGDLTKQLSGLREKLPEAAKDELDAAMATLNTTAALLRSLPVPPVPGVTKSPQPSQSPTSTKPSSPPPTTVPPPPTTTIKPPVTISPKPPVTITPLPTVEPTVSVSLPPLVP